MHCPIKTGAVVCKADACDSTARMVVVSIDASGTLALCLATRDGAPNVIAVSQLKPCYDENLSAGTRTHAGSLTS